MSCLTLPIMSLWQQENPLLRIKQRKKEVCIWRRSTCNLWILRISTVYMLVC